MREQLVFFQYNNLLLKTGSMTVSCVTQLCYWMKHLSLTPMKYVGMHVYIEKMVSMLAFFKVLQKCNLTYCIQLSFPLFLRHSNTTDIANVSRVLWCYLTSVVLLGGVTTMSVVFLPVQNVTLKNKCNKLQLSCCLLRVFLSHSYSKKFANFLLTFPTVRTFGSSWKIHFFPIKNCFYLNFASALIY